jgi:glycerophosphoryl diester phosphodiesterase
MSNINNTFQIVGHRGAKGEKLENSLDGFSHALTLAIDAIELDIREHSSQLWVFHDDNLERLTGNTGTFEAHTDPARIRLRNGEAVPTLAQVLDLYWGRRPVNIEIKSVTRLNLLLDLLASYPALPATRGHPWILISSFNHQALLQLKALDCTWPLAPIIHHIPLEFDLELEKIAPWSWHFHNEYLDFDQVRYLRDRGVASLVFTVNDPARAQFLKQNGVAGIFTDFPTEMLRVLGT